MDILRRYYQLAFRATDTFKLVFAIIIYCLITAAYGIVANIFTSVIRFKLFGWLIGTIGSLLGIYCLIGILLAILVYLGKIRD